MDVRKVNSSAISQIGLDREKQILIVKFKNGNGVYYYWPVGNEKFLEFVNSDSKGSFFQDEIRAKSTWIKQHLEGKDKLTPPREDDHHYMFKMTRDVDSFEELSEYV